MARAAALFAHEGGRLLALGLVTSALTATAAAILTLLVPERMFGLLPAFVAEVTFGKETSIPATFAAGEPAWVAIAVILAWEWNLLLVGLGLLFLARERAEGLPVIGAWLLRLRLALAKDGAPAWARRLGVAGFAAAVWIPFSPTGGLTSGTVAVLLGFPPRLLVPAILASQAGAAVFYTFVFGGVFGITGLPPPWTAWALAAASVTLAFAALARERLTRDATRG